MDVVSSFKVLIIIGVEVLAVTPDVELNSESELLEVIAFELSLVISVS